MYYNVLIEPTGHQFCVKSNETVLDAALCQGYQFPHECLSGTCGTCRGRLLQGHVEYDDEYLPGLTDEEREAGFALFCSARPASDLVIYMEGVIGPAQLPVKKLTYLVKAINPLSNTIYQVLLQPETDKHLIYRAGQYLEILQRDTSPKPFSIANAPLGDDKLIELHIRDLPNNVYMQELLNELKINNPVTVQGPYGQCILKKDPPYPLILIAGGVGFAPIKALIEEALATNFNQAIYLYWGVRTTADLYLDELAKRWQKYKPDFHYIPIISGIDNNWQGHTGFVHEAVLNNHPTLDNFHIYLSGPTEMVHAAVHAFMEHGCKRHFIYSDTLNQFTTG